MVDVQNDLVRWLIRELELRGWSQRELARRAGLSSTTVSQVLSEVRDPTWEFCAQVAQALGEPPERLLRMAGLLSQVSEARLQEFYEVAEQLAALPDGPIRDEAMAAIRAIAASARERALAREEREREERERAQ